MVVCTGLWAGSILVIAVKRTRVAALIETRDYAIDFRRAVRRLDPRMPILGVVRGLSAIDFAMASQDGGASSRTVGSGLTLLAIVASVAAEQ